MLNAKLPQRPYHNCQPKQAHSPKGNHRKQPKRAPVSYQQLFPTRKEFISKEGTNISASNRELLPSTVLSSGACRRIPHPQFCLVLLCACWNSVNDENEENVHNGSIYKTAGKSCTLPQDCHAIMQLRNTEMRRN